jgi:hypothetical protein
MNELLLFNPKEEILLIDKNYKLLRSNVNVDIDKTDTNEKSYDYEYRKGLGESLLDQPIKTIDKVVTVAQKISEDDIETGFGESFCFGSDTDYSSYNDEDNDYKTINKVDSVSEKISEDDIETDFGESFSFGSDSDYSSYKDEDNDDNNNNDDDDDDDGGDGYNRLYGTGKNEISFVGEKKLTKQVGLETDSSFLRRKQQPQQQQQQQLQESNLISSSIQGRTRQGEPRGRAAIVSRARQGEAATGGAPPGLSRRITSPTTTAPTIVGFKTIAHKTSTLIPPSSFPSLPPLSSSSSNSKISRNFLLEEPEIEEVEESALVFNDDMNFLFNKKSHSQQDATFGETDKKVNDDFDYNDKIVDVDNLLNSNKMALSDNINSVLEGGEYLEDVIGFSESLSQNAENFKRLSKKLKSKRKSNCLKCFRNTRDCIVSFIDLFSGGKNLFDNVLADTGIYFILYK